LLPEIGQLTHLEWLYLYSNGILSIPPEIGQLEQLKGLFLQWNRIDSLPTELGQLTNLCYMDVRTNRIHHLPTSFAQLTPCSDTLPLFYLDGNPLISPPPEVVEQGTNAVLNYLHNPMWYYLPGLLLKIISGLGVIGLLLFGVRLRQQHRKPKKKRAAS
jgi:hypothetical protein